jgi:hypothetical protein
MVSTIRYRSQKFASLQKERSFWYVILLAVMLVILYRWPEEFFFIGSISYVSSGPLVKLWTLAFPSGRPPAAVLDHLEEPEEEGEAPANAS